MIPVDLSQNLSTRISDVMMTSPPRVSAGPDDDNSFGAGRSSGLLPPEIASSGEVVLQAGDNATLDCIGSAPLQWKWVPEKHSQQVRLVRTHR